MLLENAGREVSLQSGKTETIVRIMSQNELDEAVAEAADAVVENDRIGARREHNFDSFMLRDSLWLREKWENALDHCCEVGIAGVLRLHLSVRFANGQATLRMTLQRGAAEDDQRELPGLRIISGTYSSSFAFSSR